MKASELKNERKHPSVIKSTTSACFKAEVVRCSSNREKVVNGKKNHLSPLTLISLIPLLCIWSSEQTKYESPQLIKDPVSGFCHCAYHTCSAGYKMCWFTGNWRSVGGSGIRLVSMNVCVCACACVCVCVCPCVPAAFVFLSQFSIPALRGECFLWVPLLFFNIYLTFCLSSDYWNDCKLVWNNRLLQSFVSEKIWWRVSKILYYKWFSFYFCTYVLCTAVNCIPEMVIKDVL